MRFKEIVDSMIAWGENHPQVKHIGWGKIDELQNLASYPCVFIVPTPSQIATNQVNEKFDIYFLDKMRHDNQNRKDVFNSMELLSVDFLNHYDLNWFNDNGFYVESPADYDRVDGDLEDYVGGIILSINCISNYDINCLAPSYPIPTPIPACICPTGTFEYLSQYYDDVYFGMNIFTVRGDMSNYLDGLYSYKLSTCDGTILLSDILINNTSTYPSWFDTTLNETHLYTNEVFTPDPGVKYCLSAYTIPCYCSDSGYATIVDMKVVDPAAMYYSYFVTVDGDYTGTVITGHTKMTVFNCTGTETLFTNCYITNVVYNALSAQTILTVYTISTITQTPGEHYCADINVDPYFNAIIYGYSGVTGGLASVSNFPGDIRSGVTIGKEYKSYGNVNAQYEYSAELNVTDVTYNGITDVTRVTFAEGGSTPLSAGTPVNIGKMETVWGTLTFTYSTSLNNNSYVDSDLISYTVGGDATSNFIVGSYARVKTQDQKTKRYQQIMDVWYNTDPTTGYDHTHILCAGGVMKNAYYIQNYNYTA